MVKRQDVFHTMKITCYDLITLENLVKLSVKHHETNLPHPPDNPRYEH